MKLILFGVFLAVATISTSLAQTSGPPTEPTSIQSTLATSTSSPSSSSSVATNASTLPTEFTTAQTSTTTTTTPRSTTTVPLSTTTRPATFTSTSTSASTLPTEFTTAQTTTRTTTTPHSTTATSVSTTASQTTSTSTAPTSNASTLPTEFTTSQISTTSTAPTTTTTQRSTTSQTTSTSTAPSTTTTTQRSTTTQTTLSTTTLPPTEATTSTLPPTEGSSTTVSTISTTPTTTTPFVPQCNENTPSVFPHPSDCSLYYTCSNGILYLQSCPSPLVFNPTTANCDWPDNVDCTNTAVHETLNSQPTECPAVDVAGEIVRIPYETNCNFYYLCNNGSRSLYRCVDEMHFNPLTRVCSSADAAGCNSCPVVDTPSQTVRIPHESNCNFYYLCNSGNSTLYMCANEYHLSPITRLCLAPDEAGCQ